MLVDRKLKKNPGKMDKNKILDIFIYYSIGNHNIRCTKSKHTLSKIALIAFI